MYISIKNSCYSRNLYYKYCVGKLLNLSLNVSYWLKQCSCIQRKRVVAPSNESPRPTDQYNSQLAALVADLLIKILARFKSYCFPLFTPLSQDECVAKVENQPAL